ncbi:Dopey [Metarhizium album ARSEF 1941]|uniref:Dopey n=1 Tax=Metarhizium album (strain ARSEF 1941) TaxID=1081103 RepID=A0A0B2WQY6_METAS|nr:Dopey [Metarhizium album ARSEF 1941]KHN96423.1 Dopey [Metarhizium album ARSEF 1941]
MALDQGSGAIAGSPESSGRDSPIPRQWRNQLGGEEVPSKDKAYRRYAAGVEKTLSLFETALEEWADYISFLNKLLKSLQARPPSFHSVPAKALVAKRLSQCLNPALPSGVHQKALELYSYIFTTIGTEGLSRDLPLYLPGLAPTLSFASLSVRSPYLDLLETHFLDLDARSLRPAMKAIILALLPGLEDETSEDFGRTLHLVARFKEAIRPHESRKMGEHHASGDDFFWQCFFLAAITSHGRRSGALAYLMRCLPNLGPTASSGPGEDDNTRNLHTIVTSPEPGLLVRCFASGLGDEQLLIQRGFLDLLVSHLPLNSDVLQVRVKPADLDLLVKAAVGVVIRRDMSLNRRLWAWLVGPEPTAQEGEHNEQSHGYLSSRTTYFEDYGLQPLTRALLQMIQGASRGSSAERARPYRICLSLMDRWEIGGLVVPEIFMPVVDSVRKFQSLAASKSDFEEVLRSASVFFDGIESGLIYSEIVGLLAQAIGPGSFAASDRMDKLALVNFIVSNFNVREEEMVTIHAPLTCLAALLMLEDSKNRRTKAALTDIESGKLCDQVLGIVVSLLELVPERAFPQRPEENGDQKDGTALPSPSNVELVKKIKTFYVHEQGNLESSEPPLAAVQSGELLLEKAVMYICDDAKEASVDDITTRVRILTLVLSKTPANYHFDARQLVSYLHGNLSKTQPLLFSHFSAMVALSTQLYAARRIQDKEFSDLVRPLVRHAWSYLSASEPKYHVETVRCLWQLQTALTLSGRDIEAAISEILTKPMEDPDEPARSADNGRTFGVLWSHSLQDASPERRGSKGQTLDQRQVPRLSGTDHYQVMLTQPVFLVLDALLDVRTQTYMVVKSWLNSMIGIDRLFLIFAMKMAQLPFLNHVTSHHANEKVNSQPIKFTEDDDFDLCVYYLRTLYNVLRASGDMSRAVLASKYVSFSDGSAHIRAGAEGDEMTLQDFFVRVCMICVVGEQPSSASPELGQRVSQLHRFALTVLHEFLLSRYATPLSSLELDQILVDKLAKSINTPDPYVQVLFLDVVYDSVKLRQTEVQEAQSAEVSEKRPTSADNSRMRHSSVSSSERRPIGPPMPSALLKCLQAGLSSPNSQCVLDSWVVFLSQIVVLYSHSIFQTVIPLVETLCKHIGSTFAGLRDTFLSGTSATITTENTPESTLIYLLNGLEQVLALAHDQLLAEEARAQLIKGPEQPSSLFGSMVSGVFQSEGPQSRSATANDRLTVHLAFQDAMRICYAIWSWGQGDDSKKQDAGSSASFSYTSLRMRNRARRLMEHLFSAEILECLETIIDIWRSSGSGSERTQIFHFLSSLDACRPKHSMPALFNAIYSRTNPGALDPARKSTLTISLQDSDLVAFLVEYSRSLEDDAMDEIWQDCMIFLKDLLGNPFPHRQTLPSLVDFAAILGEKVDNTNFGEQKRMRRELGDIFLRLLAALFTTRPLTFTEAGSLTNASLEKGRADGSRKQGPTGNGPDDIVSVMASVVPNLSKILVEPDRVLSAAGTISTNVVGPTLRSKSFPETVTRHTLRLLHELSRLQNNQKTWKRDVGDAFNDNRFFGMSLDLVKDGWLPLLKQWVLTDKERMPEIVSRISAPTTAGIVFGVGATSARLEADRKTQLNLRRIATLVLAAADDGFVAELPAILDKLVELLSATSTSSPSSTTRADVYLVMRALALKTSPVHLAMLWPVVNAEMHAAMSSVVAPDHSAASDVYVNTGVLQACKLLDLLVCAAPDDFQLHEWLFITDTIEAVHRSSTYQPVALVDELSEELGNLGTHDAPQTDTEEEAHGAATGPHRRPLLGPGGISDDVSLERKDELVAKVLRPFFGQLSIYAFESTYAMGAVDREACTEALLKDVFDERTMVRAL